VPFSVPVDAAPERISSPDFPDDNWYIAVVPGTVLTTLIANGVYPDPDYGLNNLAIPESLNRQDYWYRSEFVAPAQLGGRQLTLTFNGINFAAEVWLNGVRLGGIRGAFMRGTFDVSAIVHAGGRNVLAVRISPPPHPGIPHEQSVAAGPGENGGNLDTKETVVGTTLLFPCFIDGCGLFAGDVHYAQGGGEVSGTAIEMGAKVTLRAKVLPGMASLLSTMHFEGSGGQLKKLAPSSFYAVSGLPLKPEGELPAFSTYLGGQKIAPLANLSEDVSLAARNATLNMIDFLVATKGLTREQAYILTSVAVDLNIAQLVDVPNLGVTAILNRDVFQPEPK
jgi:acetamidase/formamidase